MVSTYTTNKAIEKPASGDYVNTWATPVNADWDIIDKAFGGTTNINVTAVSGTVVLTSTQYQALILNITGTLTANVTYQVPSTVGGQWIVKNGTTGSYTVTISSGGAGTSLVVPQGYSTVVVSDGTNITRADTTPVAAAGSNTQIQYNVSGVLGASSNLTFDGATVSVVGDVTIGNVVLASPSVSGSGTTITVTAANNLSAGKTVVLAGWTGGTGTFNGTWTVATATTTSFTIAAGSVSGSPTGGTVTALGSLNVASTLGVTGAITGSNTVTGTALIPSGASVPANGVYLPAANTVGVATNTTERLRIDSTGAWGLAGANYGTSGQVLTSSGPGAPPTWVNSSVKNVQTFTTTGANTWTKPSVGNVVLASPSVSGSGTIITVTAANNLSAGNTVVLAGWTGGTGTFNGTWTVASATTTSFIIAAGSVSGSPTGGTVTALGSLNVAGTWALVEMWGAGGSGSRQSNASNTDGGGGGGYLQFLVPLSALAATETLTVGTGGVARTGSNQAGAAGGNTTFTIGGVVGATVNGGSGGGTVGGGTGTGGAGLGGTSLNANVILLQYESGATGAGAGVPINATSTVMGGGGGAASGAAASTPFWLGSGAGGAVGVAGTAPGGGGGGSTTTSGAGANGKVIVTVF